MIKTIEVREGQSLKDLAIQLYGMQSEVFSLAKLNNLTIGYPLIPGQVLFYDDSIGNKLFKNYAINRNLIVSTAGSGRGDFNDDFNFDFY